MVDTVLRLFVVDLLGGGITLRVAPSKRHRTHPQARGNAAPEMHSWRKQMNNNREVENFLASFKFTASTKDSYRRILNKLIIIEGLDQLDAAGLIQFITRPGWGNSQQNVAIFCAQKFLRWCYGDHHPALSATIPHIKPKPRRSLNPDQALQLLASFDTYTPIGARDLAILAIGLDTGFRRAELCSLQLADLDFYSNTARALCKGEQWGYGAFSPQTAIIIQEWIRYRKPADGVGKLFVNIKTGRALTGSGMACIFKAWSRVIGFKVSPHDLRSSFATLSTIFGMSARAGQLAGRWSSIEMFEHYTGNLQLDAARPYLPMANITRLEHL
jgi:integrase